MQAPESDYAGFVESSHLSPSGESIRRYSRPLAGIRRVNAETLSIVPLPKVASCCGRRLCGQIDRELQHADAPVAISIKPEPEVTAVEARGEMLADCRDRVPGRIRIRVQKPQHSALRKSCPLAKLRPALGFGGNVYGLVPLA